MRPSVLIAILLATVLGAGEAELRAQAEQARREGNWRDSFELYRRLVEDPATSAQAVAGDLGHALACLDRLQRLRERDALIETAVVRHAGSWRLLWRAAQAYAQGPHHGVIIAGRFERGPHRGDGQWAYAAERDRIRALQLMQQAMPPGAEPREAGYWFDFAQMVARSGAQAWRLQHRSDLAELPPWDEPGADGDRGAPVDAAGQPVFHRVPESWEAAASDGERWRWLLARGAKDDPGTATWHLASAMQRQFDVHTLLGFGWRWGQDAEEGDPAANPWALEGLADDETIARLATGARRFTLPAEFRFLALLKAVAEAGGGSSRLACGLLAESYENRRQFAAAAAWWIRAGRPERARQITGAWGCFEEAATQPIGSTATLDYRFRNAAKASFSARPIDVERLLADLRSYIETQPKQLDWERTDLSDIGRHLIWNNRDQYVGAVAKAWEVALQPRPGHADRRVAITVPELPAGAWLVEAQAADGNVSRIVLWLADLALVHKPAGNGQAILWAVDAASGEPVAGAAITAFGWRRQWKNDATRIETISFEGATDADGLFVTRAQPEHHQFLFTARQGPRRAFLGWAGVWNLDRDHERYDAVKTLVITDRPAYRPGQAVKVTAWTARARYDAPAADSEFAGQPCNLILYDPKGEEVARQRLVCDRFGGVQGEFALPAHAALGVWRIEAEERGRDGVAIRVEEYKKPEFEVTVTPPAEPIVLGGKLQATLKAAYYFGAPVAGATVTYRVLRHEHDQRWFPDMPWDWLYGPGYWWFDSERPWYPGWRAWGCRTPRWAWSWHGEPPPELVADGEGRLGPDGTLTIEIDSGPAQRLHGDVDHRYEIRAEVTDASRRTIVGSGSVIAARKPFAVTVWGDRGWVQAGSAVEFRAAARTPDGKAVSGEARIRLLKIAYAADGTPAEREVAAQAMALDADGRLAARFVLAEHGQYRCAVAVSDGRGRTGEGAAMLSAVGTGTAADYRFNAIDIAADKAEYAPGDQARLLLGVGRAGAAVLLFERPANGVYPRPRVLRLRERQAVVPIAIASGDMPNCFVEALTVHGGQAAVAIRELVVPPVDRTLNVELVSDAARYKPGTPATVTIKVRDPAGKPVAGALALTMYDQALEYISGGRNVPEIRAFFWKWRRHHQPDGACSLDRISRELLRQTEEAMAVLGCFGQLGADDEAAGGSDERGRKYFLARGEGGAASCFAMPAAPLGRELPLEDSAAAAVGDGAADGGEPATAPTVRTNFADAAFWSATLVADADGLAQVVIPMPENLTGWKLRTWAMAPGVRVGEAAQTVTTAKDLLVRLQAPRFFQERDEVVLSANVHNYLPAAADCTVSIALPGPCLKLLGPPEQRITVAPGEDRRVDWRVQVLAAGEAVVRIAALSAQESDAMEQRFPVKVHGAPIQIAWSRVLRPEQPGLTIPFTVPAERRPAETWLEVRWSPTLAGALVDALPYLADYPYGCTEQTLNRFLPTVICQRVLQDLQIDFGAIRAKRANLDPQELGDPRLRAGDWQRGRRPGSPVAVWDEATVAEMVQAGVERLRSMQLPGGGWGWFSGWGERPSAHLSSLVVRGLLRARDCGATVDLAMLDRGLTWLQGEQVEQVRLIRLWESSGHKDGKAHADSLDALVDLALVEAGRPSAEMAGLLARDAAELTPYGTALFALACHRRGDREQVAKLRRNLEQFLKHDDENQSAWLELPSGSWWWSWQGDEIETQAAYLKLLAATDPGSAIGARLVKHLLNNRKHATRWNSTRDTALVIDAMADWLGTSGEARPDCTVEVLLDGRLLQTARITPENLFGADLALRLEGEALTTGAHRLELRRTGAGPLYANAYLGYFSLEEGIAKQGLEVKVERAMYRLVPAPRDVQVEGAAGQVLDRQVEAWARVPLADAGQVSSGDLVEVELTIESKNDYEYLLFLDPKVAGFEPFETRSGYLEKGLRAYAEWRDDRSCLFVERLPRGRHSLAWRMRAEIPGRFHALPTRAEAMYAPELRANADELRLEITEVPPRR